MNGDHFSELKDFLVTLSIAFRYHNGKVRKMKKVAENIRQRLIYPQVIRYCDQFIAAPERTEFMLNAASENFFGIQFLKIKRFNHGE